MTYVMDASVAASLFLPDEDAGTAAAIFSGLAPTDVITVPSLFWYEMMNVLAGSLRHGRLDEGPAFRVLEMLRGLGFSMDSRSIEEAAPAIFMLSREHGLTAYDAAYLELASREGATLCSHDSGLRAAATKAAIPLLPSV